MVVHCKDTMEAMFDSPQLRLPQTVCTDASATPQPGSFDSSTPRFGAALLRGLVQRAQMAQQADLWSFGVGGGRLGEVGGGGVWGWGWSGLGLGLGLVWVGLVGWGPVDFSHFLKSS